MKLIGICFYYENLNKKNFVLLNSNAGIGDDLLKPFNLSAYETTFWDKGVAMITGLMDELETLKA